jgi:hypothetical protein
MTYYAYAHSVMSYGIIFWGNSTHSNQIFKIQKRIVRIITKALVKHSSILLTIYTLYIYICSYEHGYIYIKF